MMKKRILSILLALALAACLLPAAALADGVVTEVSITGLERPEAGGTPDTEFAASGPEGTELSVDCSVEWVDLATGEPLSAPDTYSASRDYEATIKLRPGEGFAFPGTANELSVTVEDPGYKAGISAISSAEVTIKVTYHVLDRVYGAGENAVSVFSGETHTIAGGEKVYSEDINSDSEGVTVSEAKWYRDGAEAEEEAEPLAEGAVFGAGHSYTLRLTLAADAYTLFDDDLSVVYTLNGEDYAGLVTVSADGGTACADFTFAGLKGQVRDYAIEGIQAPAAGEEPQTTGFMTAEGSGYEAGFVRWTGEFDDGKFKTGEHYTLTLSLAAKDGYTLDLSDKEAVSVNAGTVEKLGSDSGTKQPAVDIGFDVAAVETPEGDPADSPKENPFEDVKEGDYFHDAVLWAFYHDPQITDGVTDTEFGPHAAVTRGQAVAFLWRAMGKPEASITENPFKDVDEGDYFYEAVLWALDQGVTDGVSDDEFAPDAALSTAHIATFLYRAIQGEGVDGWYQEATDWVLELGLMNGINTMIAENVSCPRANVVTFLYLTLN